MYERIIVPLDGSELAELALPYAEEIAGKLGSEITLIHVSRSGTSEHNHLLEFYMRKTVETTANGAQKHAGAYHKGQIKVASTSLVGNAAEEIVDYAEEQDIGLIIMATHGRSGIRRWMMGSVADKVVRATNKPIILIRAKGGHPEVRENGLVNKVLVPLDGSQISEAVIPYVEELALRLKAEVILFQSVEQDYKVLGTGDGAVHIPYSPEEMKPIVGSTEAYLKKVEKNLVDKGVTASSEVGIGNAAQEIIEFADDISADLVVMSTHGHSGIMRWNFGGVAEKILLAGNTPLLLVRASLGNV